MKQREGHTTSSPRAKPQRRTRKRTGRGRRGSRTRRYVNIAWLELTEARNWRTAAKRELKGDQTRFIGRASMTSRYKVLRRGKTFTTDVIPWKRSKSFIRLAEGGQHRSIVAKCEGVEAVGENKKDRLRRSTYRRLLRSTEGFREML